MKHSMLPIIIIVSLSLFLIGVTKAAGRSVTAKDGTVLIVKILSLNNVEVLDKNGDVLGGMDVPKRCGFRLIQTSKGFYIVADNGAARDGNIGCENRGKAL